MVRRGLPDGVTLPPGLPPHIVHAANTLPTSVLQQYIDKYPKDMTANEVMQMLGEKGMEPPGGSAGIILPQLPMGDDDETPMNLLDQKSNLPDDTKNHNQKTDNPSLPAIDPKTERHIKHVNHLAERLGDPMFGGVAFGGNDTWFALVVLVLTISSVFVLPNEFKGFWLAIVALSIVVIMGYWLFGEWVKRTDNESQQNMAMGLFYGLIILYSFTLAALLLMLLWKIFSITRANIGEDRRSSSHGNSTRHTRRSGGRRRGYD